MSISQRNDAACCRVTGAGAFTSNDGFNTLVRTGAGAYTVKTDKTWDLLGVYVQASCFGGAANANIQVTSADGLNWTINTSVAAVATDETWMLLIEPIFAP